MSDFDPTSRDVAMWCVGCAAAHATRTSEICEICVTATGVPMFQNPLPPPETLTPARPKRPHEPGAPLIPEGYDGTVDVPE